MHFETSNSILQTIDHPLLKEHNVTLFVKRDDLIHPEVSGNKWRKLKYNVQQFEVMRNESILTFGGAYSNHLLATASACAQLNIPCIGIVRGEELNPQSNTLLARCAELGMHLHFVTREEYALRDMSEYFEELKGQFPNCYIIPEGGANYYGMIGCQELVKELPDFDHLFVAQGTAATSAGVLLGLRGAQRLGVVPAIKSFDAKGEMTRLYRKAGLDDETIEELFDMMDIYPDAHFGGYAKTTDELMSFMDFCRTTLDLRLDKVYTAKAFYALWNQVAEGALNDSTVIFLHTGGLGSHSEQ